MDNRIETNEVGNHTLQFFHREVFPAGVYRTLPSERTQDVIAYAMVKGCPIEQAWEQKSIPPETRRLAKEKGWNSCIDVMSDLIDVQKITDKERFIYRDDNLYQHIQDGIWDDERKQKAALELGNKDNFDKTKTNFWKMAEIAHKYGAPITMKMNDRTIQEHLREWVMEMRKVTWLQNPQSFETQIAQDFPEEYFQAASQMMTIAFGDVYTQYWQHMKLMFAKEHEPMKIKKPSVAHDGSITKPRLTIPGLGEKGAPVEYSETEKDYEPIIHFNTGVSDGQPKPMEDFGRAIVLHIPGFEGSTLVILCDSHGPSEEHNQARDLAVKIGNGMEEKVVHALSLDQTNKSAGENSDLARRTALTVAMLDLNRETMDDPKFDKVGSAVAVYLINPDLRVLTHANAGDVETWVVKKDGSSERISQIHNVAHVTGQTGDELNEYDLAEAIRLRENAEGIYKNAYWVPGFLQLTREGAGDRNMRMKNKMLAVPAFAGEIPLDDIDGVASFTDGVINALRSAGYTVDSLFKEEIARTGSPRRGFQEGLRRINQILDDGEAEALRNGSYMDNSMYAAKLLPPIRY